MEAILVILHTSMGDIKLELNKEKAPVTVENFVGYVNDGHYNGTVFHRVIDGFMIQGGGFDKDMQQKPTKDPIKNEANNGLKNDLGTIAMARTQDPHSASAQFFINIKSYPASIYSNIKLQTFSRVVLSLCLSDHCRFRATYCN